MIKPRKIITITFNEIEDVYRFMDRYIIRVCNIKVDKQNDVFKLIFKTRENTILDYRFYNGNYNIEEVDDE